MRVLVWHVHGSWLTAFVQGNHEYVVPVLPDRGPDGRGRAKTWSWPAAVVERTPAELADLPVDVVVLQRPNELLLTERWLRRRPGQDLPAVYVEHDAPSREAADTRHLLSSRQDVPLVHVTAFNALMWDNGCAPVRVIEHGVVDPGYRYSGQLGRAAVVVNEPVRRARTVGSDLIAGLSSAAPLDVFGMGVSSLHSDLGLDRHRVETYEDLPQSQMHAELARRRAYVHLTRWTSLGLSLIEAMHLGLPVVALATTEAVVAVPRGTGELSLRADELGAAVRRYIDDPELARATGLAARAWALEHYGLDRFLHEWDVLLKEVAE